MPHLPPSELMIVIAMGLFTAVAAVIDMRTRRIPNKMTVPVFAAGILFQVGCMIFAPRFPTVWAAVADMLKAFGVGFGVLFVRWMIGGGGGGDVKLMGAISVWLGFDRTLYVLALSTVVVLLGTLAAMCWGAVSRGLQSTKKEMTQARAARAAGAQPQRRLMTYAFPVAVATWVVLLWFSFVKPTLAKRNQAQQGHNADVSRQAM